MRCVGAWVRRSERTGEGQEKHHWNENQKLLKWNATFSHSYNQKKKNGGNFSGKFSDTLHISFCVLFFFLIFFLLIFILELLSFIPFGSVSFDWTSMWRWRFGFCLFFCVCCSGAGCARAHFRVLLWVDVFG